MFNISKRLSIIVFSLICCLSLSIVLRATYEKHLYFVDELWQISTANAPEPTTGRVNSNFFNKWNERTRWYNLLNTTQDTKNEWSHVYKNLEPDMHPPLSFLLLNTVSSLLFDGKASKWPMVIINIIFFIVSLIFLYKIMIFLTGNRLIANLVVLIYTTSKAGVFFVTYVRSYEIYLSLIIMSLYAHLKFYPYLLDSSSNGKIPKDITWSIIGVGICYFFGFFNHFQFVIFAFFLSLGIFIISCVRKKWDFVFRYSWVSCLGIVLNFIVFPQSFFVLIGKQEDSSNALFHFLYSNIFTDISKMIQDLDIYIYIKHWFIALGVVLFLYMLTFIEVSRSSEKLTLKIKNISNKTFSFYITPQNLCMISLIGSSAIAFCVVTKMCIESWMRYVCFVIPVFYIFIGWCVRSKRGFVVLIIAALISLSYIKPSEISWVQCYDPQENFLVNNYNQGKTFDVVLYYPHDKWFPLINYTRNFIYSNKVYITRDFDTKIKTDTDELLVIFIRKIYKQKKLDEVPDNILDTVQKNLNYSKRIPIGREEHGSMWLFSRDPSNRGSKTM